MLFTTSEEGKQGGKAHSHLAYINQDGTGITSVDDGHAHPIAFNPPQEAVVDEFGQVIAEATPGAPVIQEVDGHSHLAGPEEQLVKKSLFNVPETKDAEANSVQRNKALYKEAKAVEKDSRIEADKAEKLYEGDQWDKALKDQLKDEGRAAVTVNEIEGKIDLLSGVQRQNRQDIKFWPVEGGDARVADIITICVKHVMDRDYDRNESKVFEDGTIVGKGGISVDTDFDKDIRGQIVPERFNWRDFMYGPHEKDDASDADYLVKFKWLSLKKLKEMYPEKADEITIDYEKLSEKEKPDGAIEREPATDPYREPFGKESGAEGDGTFTNITKKEYCLIETWQKVFARVYIAVNAVDGFYESIVGWDKKQIKQLKSIEGLGVIARVIFQFRVTTTASEVLLEDEFPDLPTIRGEQFYQIVPLYAKKRRNKWWGKVRSVKDLQLEINKRHSQGIDILNKAMPYGWFYDDGTFATLHDEETFRKGASKPGFKVKLATLEKKPELEQGVKYPAELVNEILLLSNKMKEIMNINTEFMGQSGKQISGVAIKENKRSGLLGNDFLFDNLMFMRLKVALMVVAHIQKYWDVDRILRIVGFQADQAPEGEQVNVGGQPVEPQNTEQMQELARILEDQDLTTYDVKPADSAKTPTARLGNFLIIAELAKQGVQIPAKTLIELSDVPNKEQILKDLAAEQKAAAEFEEKKLQVEIQKTAMAQENRGGQNQ